MWCWKPIYYFALKTDPETFWMEIAKEKLCFCAKFLPFWELLSSQILPLWDSAMFQLIHPFLTDVFCLGFIIQRWHKSEIERAEYLYQGRTSLWQLVGNTHLYICTLHLTPLFMHIWEPRLLPAWYSLLSYIDVCFQKLLFMSFDLDFLWKKRLLVLNFPPFCVSNGISIVIFF